ncbi:hypothetical protein D3C86_1849620 [compost metagenome]
MVDRLRTSGAAGMREKPAAYVRDNFQSGTADDFASTVRADSFNSILPYANAFHAGGSIVFHRLRKSPGLRRNGVDTAPVKCYIFQFGEMIMGLI